MVTTSGFFRILGRLVLLGFLVGLAVVVLYPLIWMGISSLKTNGEILSSPFAMPHTPDLSSYGRAWERGVGQYFMNSALVTVVSVLLTTLISAWAAFGLSRIEIPFSRVFLLLIVGG